MKLWVIVTTSIFIAVCTGCANQSSPSMTGNWVLTTNTGQRFDIAITQINKNQLNISAEKIHISGLYQLLDQSIVLVKANQPRITSVEFSLGMDGRWMLISAPPAPRLGLQLSGSTLTRSI